MQVTETSAEGLRRELKVVIGAEELEQRLLARLDELKDRVKLKGFRPGRVPRAHLRKVYGRSVMAEVVQQAVAETSQAAITDRQERAAVPPNIALPEDEAEIANIFEGKSDLAYTMSFEVLPKIDIMDLSTLAIERPVAPVADDDIDKALERLRTANVDYTPKDGPAESGDRLTADLVGKIDGKEFKGGTVEATSIVLGSGTFIPGFEKGLLGAKAGEERVVEATFPQDYQEASLAGKQARFEVKVKEVAAPEMPALDKNLAKKLGLESLEKLRDTVKQQLEQERGVASRLKMKRMLLDVLNEGHRFELPPSLVDNEFEAIWQQVQQDLERANKSFEDEGTTEEKARTEYRDIAERRVRLGLLLSEIGTQQHIQVGDEEVNRALLERIKQFPGKERQVYDYYRENPRMLAELRAPIFEDKVIDYVVELAQVTEKPVSVEDLYSDSDNDHDHDHGHDHDHQDHAQS